MPASVTGVIIGIAILGCDFIVWRLSSTIAVNRRKAIRTLLFASLSYVLFHFGMTPFGRAPWPDVSIWHILGQGLALIWWLYAAQFSTVVLDSFVLPSGWQRERLFQDVLSALIFIAAAIAGVAFVLQLPVQGLLATSGAVAVVLGLALQSTLNDVFSGVVLNATQPFRLGDWVSVSGVEGRVVETNWRATTLINGRGNQIVIPNSVAAKANIVNNSQPALIHGVSVTLQAPPEVRPARVLEALEYAAINQPEVLSSPSPLVSVVRATLQVIEYELVCYVQSAERMAPVKNALFDLCHRHLNAFAIDLHAPSIFSRAPVEHNPLRRLLKAVEIFNSLSDAELDAMAQHMTRQEYQTGDTIYHSDESAIDGKQALYMLEVGVAGVYLKGASGGEIRRMAPGDAIGQSAILSGVALNAVVRALTPVSIYRLDKNALTPIIKNRPEVAQIMCKTISDRSAYEASLMSSASIQATPEHGVLHWLRQGMKRLHDLDF